MKPDDPKVRSLPKTNKSVQQKILNHIPAVKFLENAGFSFDEDTIQLKEFNKEVLEEGLEAIAGHVLSLGGNVAKEGGFDPTKEIKINNSSDSFTKPPGLDKE